MAAAAAMLVLAGPAAAQSKNNSGMYIALGAGGSFNNDSDLASGGVTAVVGYDPGFAGTGAVGYSFGNGFAWKANSGLPRMTSTACPRRSGSLRSP